MLQKYIITGKNNIIVYKTAYKKLFFYANKNLFVLNNNSNEYTYSIMININELLKYFPSNIAKKINKSFNFNINNLNLLEEIRIRVNKPIILKLGQAETIIQYIVNSEEILEILSKICDNSIYSFQNQIINGFITIKGGHRIGITGNVVIKDGKVTNISYISSLNFRIAKQIIRCK